MKKSVVFIALLCWGLLSCGIGWAQAEKEKPTEGDAPAQAAAPSAEQAKPAEEVKTQSVVDKGKELLKKSDDLWQKRQKSGWAMKSIKAAEKAMTFDADEFECQWRVARGCFWVAERNPDSKIKESFGKKGWIAGQKAAELQPQRVEGWFWGVVSLGQYSTGIGLMRAFFKGIASDFEKMNEKAIKLDGKYEMGGPLRSYGRYWFSVPSVKRDLDRSEKLLKQSIAAAPKKLRTHFYLAETYLENDKKDLAKQELELCLKLDPKAEEYADGIIFKKDCQALYDKEFKK